MREYTGKRFGSERDLTINNKDNLFLVLTSLVITKTLLLIIMNGSCSGIYIEIFLSVYIIRIMSFIKSKSI